MKSEDWRGTVWAAGQRTNSEKTQKIAENAEIAEIAEITKITELQNEIGGLGWNCFGRGSADGFWKKQKTENRKPLSQPTLIRNSKENNPTK